jgi:CheY-like chemotaxis protein/Tfp pilus assembly protein PilZ
MSPTILVVDDEEFLRQAIGFDFEMRNFNVLMAGSGREAFEIVQREKIDVILSDVRMPNGDGLELLDRVKAFNPALPLIFVSGYADLTLEEAYARGAEAVFPKPFDRKALALAVDNAIQDGSLRLGRKNTRVGSDLAVGIRLRKGSLIEGKIKNLGRGGMFLELASGFPPCAEELEFRLSLPETGTEISGSGVVRWVRMAGSEQLPAGCGIEFAGLDDTCLAQVVELINESKTKAFIPRS